MAKDDYVPIIKTRQIINIEAKSRINQERSGKQLGLKSRFGGLNICLGKYFRFGQVTLIAGMSGHAKSALLNMLLEDFKNKELNKAFTEDLIIIHNTFEMLPVDEVLRTISNKAEKSHLNLLSAEWNKTLNKYNTISNDEYEYISKLIDETEDDDHYYFEEPTNISGLLKNILAGIKYYQEKYNKSETVFPKVVVALDHTLLLNPDKNESNLDLMARLGKTAVWLKKRGYMVLLVGQFNGEIEAPERIKNNQLHFPSKKDIYAQGQLYNACDNVLTIHMPEKLGILLYGLNMLVSNGLIHLQIIKQRFGEIGSVWLKNELNKGKMTPYTPESRKTK